MNYQTFKNTHAVFCNAMLKTLSAIILLAAIASVTAAQNQPTPSTDRDNPAQLASNIITGDGVDSKTEYFYSFTAGPGEVKLTLDLKNKKKKAGGGGFNIPFFSTHSHPLLPLFTPPPQPPPQHL